MKLIKSDGLAIKDGLLTRMVDTKDLTKFEKEKVAEGAKSFLNVKDGIFKYYATQNYIDVYIAFSKKKIKQKLTKRVFYNDEAMQKAYDELTKDIVFLDLLIPDMEFRLSVDNSSFLSFNGKTKSYYDFYPISNSYSDIDTQNFYNICVGNSLTALDITMSNILEKSYEAVNTFLSSPNNGDLEYVWEQEKRDIPEHIRDTLSYQVSVCEVALHYLSEKDYLQEVNNHTDMKELLGLAYEYIKDTRPHLEPYAKTLFITGE